MIAVPDDKLYILSENFYGKPTVGELLSTGVTTDMALLQGILDETEGGLPNDVGAVASYDGCRVRSDAAIKANSLKMSSYNRLGQKVKQWTIYGLEGAPATQASFTYNVSGELSATETAERKGKSWSTISSLAYYYDDMGRLKSVLESGDSLMRIDRTEAFFFGAEGRGAYIGATVAGIHGEVSDRDGESWGLEEALYYKLRNDGTDPETKKPRKYVGLNIPSLGIFSDVVMYDHGNRNDNQKEVMGKDGKGISREQFEKLAKDNDLDYGKYPWIASLFHPSNTDKMWMEQKSVFRFLYGWFWIPSVEGLFFPGGDYASAPSYNYGHNWITHFFLDVWPYLIMD